MSSNSPMPASQRVVQVCLFIVAAIALFGGTVQMILGQPDTTARLDNVHRFMAGVYFSCGVINLWAAVTIRRQGTLVYLLAFGVLMAGIGRLVSISQVGLPQPACALARLHDPRAGAAFRHRHRAPGGGGATAPSDLEGWPRQGSFRPGFALPQTPRPANPLCSRVRRSFEMNLFAWDPKYCLNIQEIDSQHQHLFVLFNVSTMPCSRGGRPMSSTKSWKTWSITRATTSPMKGHVCPLRLPRPAGPPGRARGAGAASQDAERRSCTTARRT